MKRVMLTEPEHFVVQEVPIPQPGPDEVILKIANVGICGSDIHIYRGLSPRTRPPLVLGHEFSGTVHLLGPGVQGFSIGDSVTAEPLIECGQCTYCRSGRYNLCPELYAIGSRLDHPGAYAEYVTVPARKLYALPTDMSFAEGAMIELTACAIHAQKRANIAPGAVALIIGSGSLGILLAQAARLAGAATIAVADLAPTRLALAKQLGADVAVNVADTDLRSWAEQAFGGGGITHVFDTVATAETFNLAFAVVRRGGRIVKVGVSTQSVTWQPNMLLLTEVELTGTNMYTRPDYEEALIAVREGRMQVAPLITATYPLTQIEEAYDRVIHDPNRCKIMLAPASNQYYKEEF